MSADRQPDAYEERLLDLACDALPPGEAREVEAHAAGCAACREALARMRATRRTMAALPPEPAPARGEAALLAAARAQADRNRFRRRRRAAVWLAPTAAVAGLVVAATWQVTLSRQALPGRSDPDALAMPEAPPAEPAPAVAPAPGPGPGPGPEAAPPAAAAPAAEAPPPPPARRKQVASSRFATPPPETSGPGAEAPRAPARADAAERKPASEEQASAPEPARREREDAANGAYARAPVAAAPAPEQQAAGAGAAYEAAAPPPAAAKAPQRSAQTGRAEATAATAAKPGRCDAAAARAVAVRSARAEGRPADELEPKETLGPLSWPELIRAKPGKRSSSLPGELREVSFWYVRLGPAAPGPGDAAALDYEVYVRAEGCEVVAVERPR